MENGYDDNSTRSPGTDDEGRGVSILMVLTIIIIVSLSVSSTLLAIKVRRLESAVIYLNEQQEGLSDIVDEMSEVVDTLKRTTVDTVSATDESTPVPETNEPTPVPEPNGPVPISRN